MVVAVANGSFGQQWQLNEEDEDEEERSNDTTVPVKRQKLTTNCENVFASRRALMRYLQDASYMNLKMIAEMMMNKDDQVVINDVDDTTKAAGRRIFNGWCGHGFESHSQPFLLTYHEADLTYHF